MEWLASRQGRGAFAFEARRELFKEAPWKLRPLGVMEKTRSSQERMSPLGIGHQRLVLDRG